MFSFPFAVKILQLVLFFVWCLRFRPTKKWVVIAACIPALSLLQSGSYESGDFVTHIVRAMDLFSSLHYGIFPVRWAWLLQGGFGYPLFSFMTTLPYYVLACLHVLHVPFVVGMKLYLAGVYVGSAYTMWLCVRSVFVHHKKRDVIATLTAASYVFAPYTLANLSFRAASGELTGFLLIPLLIYAVYEKKHVLFAFAFGILLLSHPGITLLGMPWVFFLIVMMRQWRMIPSFFIGIGLSAFYLLPMLVEKAHTGQVTYGNTLWTPSTIPGFQPAFWLLWSPWRYGFLLQGHYGEIATTIGAAQIGAIVSLLYMYAKKHLFRRDAYIFMFLFVVLSIGIFMSIDVSRPVWNALPLIRHLQFPSRIMFYVVFSTSLMLGYVLSQMHLRAPILKLTIFFCFGYLILNWSHRTFHPELTDEVIFTSLPRASFEHERLPEAMPIGIDQPMYPRKMAYQTNQHDAVVTRTSFSPIDRRYTIITPRQTKFQENTLFFPGWVAHIDDKRVPLFTTPQGVMIIDIPEGTHTVTFTFEDTPIRVIGNIISLSVWSGMSVYALYVLFHRSAKFFQTHHAEPLNKIKKHRK